MNDIQCVFQLKLQNETVKNNKMEMKVFGMMHIVVRFRVNVCESQFDN